jgi:DNA mismatch endonuclease, patch repair protein
VTTSAAHADVPVVARTSRSLLMGRVRRTGTAPELYLRRALHRSGLRYRLASGAGLPGTPDLAFRRAHVAVFVDGCFWHGCPKHGTVPKTNTKFWTAKIRRNRQRDRHVDQALRDMGWKVVRVCEDQVRTRSTKIVSRIQRLMKMAAR